MKKFMKAIAFVTVMCLALSTVAFAAGSAVPGDADKTVNITVTGAGNDQVALVVVAEGADLSNPLYIDQKGAVDGTAAFTAVLTNADVEAVDVYVGYATYANAGNAGPEFIDTVELESEITNVTIAKFETELIQASEALKAEDQTGSGAAVTFDVVAPEGVSATHMFWAIRFTDAEGDHVKYSKKFDVTDYGIGSTLTTGIKLGLAFINGSDFYEIDPVTITAVDAIFLFEGEGFRQDVLTNEADAANKL